ncbi:ycf3-interacting protein 1, chloroplastic-like isoform X1 [Papaver somniferum]|uniref:ycf3-interacting protein 1, chloroplastic-like isoform X1 n=1 Tax=Papaver somniferum TaxID=3469 RepID=UPI000E703599|nr:ycf3-interacting protein 1, chloroplastic-like isoform X1 [Papaver somniferum]
MALRLSQLPLASSSYSSCTATPTPAQSQFLFFQHLPLNYRTKVTLSLHHRHQRNNSRQILILVGKENAELGVSTTQEDDNQPPLPQDATPEELEYIQQIKRVIELLKKNRDMLFSEIKLTISIEDPREVERRRLLGIDDPDTPTRDDLAEALDEVNEGRVPENRVALQMLATEMLDWPNVEVQSINKKPSKSLYAKATNTGVDPKVAAKRLKIDWDTAAEIDDDEDSDQVDVPAAVGFGALYLVTALPVIIGVSVVLILFFNSLQ